jgi:DNA-binding transcriptional ArsR family regulator
MKSLINIFLNGSYHTVNELARKLEVPPSTVASQLEKLVDLDIVKTTNPSSAGVRQYGRKYYLNSIYKPKVIRINIFASSIIVSTFVGMIVMILTLRNPLALLLLFPSFTGVAFTASLWTKIRANALNTILDKVQGF